MDQYWSWVLTAVGLTGFVLAGKKIWWCWYINIACQGLWMAYAIVTEQWGFIVASLAFTFVFTKNAIKWTKEHRALSVSEILRSPIAKIVRVWDDEMGVYAEGVFTDANGKARSILGFDPSERYTSYPTVEVRKDECLADECKKGPLSCGYCMAHCLCGIGK